MRTTIAVTANSVLIGVLIAFSPARLDMLVTTATAMPQFEEESSGGNVIEGDAVDLLDIKAEHAPDFDEWQKQNKEQNKKNETKGKRLERDDIIGLWQGEWYTIQVTKEGDEYIVKALRVYNDPSKKRAMFPFDAGEVCCKITFAYVGHGALCYQGKGWRFKMGKYGANERRKWDFHSMTLTRFKNGDLQLYFSSGTDVTNQHLNNCKMKKVDQ